MFRIKTHDNIYTCYSSMRINKLIINKVISTNPKTVTSVRGAMYCHMTKTFNVKHFGMEVWSTGLPTFPLSDYDNPFCPIFGCVKLLASAAAPSHLSSPFHSTEMRTRVYKQCMHCCIPIRWVQASHA